MTVKAEAQQLTWGLESTYGTPPGVTTPPSWKQVRFLPGGVKGLNPKLKTVADNSVSANAQDEKGDIVDHDSTPSLQMIVCKDNLDTFGQLIARATEGFVGGGKRWYPTAFTSTAATVDALGALPAITGGGLLLFVRGAATPGNNGVHLVGTGSTGTSIVAAGFTAETVSPVNSVLAEVCGVQGASGDIGIDASGNLTSTAGIFAGLGLVPGMTVQLPNNTAGCFFANTVYKGSARIVSVTANKLTLAMRQWVVGAADTGTGKTIQLLFGSALRMISINDAAYLETFGSMEMTQPGSGTGNTTEYVYNYGNALKTFALDASLTAQLQMTLSFVGTKCDAPTTSRLSGPSGAILPIAFAPYNTVGDERRLVLCDTSENAVVTKVNNWKLTYEHNVTPLKVQGTEGSVEAVFGKAQAMADMTVYLAPGGAQAAIKSYSTLQFLAMFGNGQGGFAIDCPELALSGGEPNAPENGPVTLPLSLKMNRSATFGFTLMLTRFPYLPTLS